MLKFGITTRITHALGYEETRDSIAHDWARFFKTEFQNDLWVSIPNIGKDAVQYFKSLSLNVLVLSGGDSLGETIRRDETEYALLDFALANSIPVIAVCRGMQIVNSYFGGNILDGDQKFVSTHRATRHDVVFEDGTILSLNSYHNNLIHEQSLSPHLSVLARCKEDYSIEAFTGRGLIGIMWHPEREMDDKKQSTKLLKTFIQKSWPGELF
jgi:putative glutamine amidotransferase